MVFNITELVKFGIIVYVDFKMFSFLNSDKEKIGKDLLHPLFFVKMECHISFAVKFDTEKP